MTGALYCKEIAEMKFIYLLIYVDDMLVAFTDKNEIQRLKSQLNSVFEMKDLGSARKILGMEISRDRKAKTLVLSQCGYLINVLDRF